MNHTNRIRPPISDRILVSVIYVILFGVLIVVAYPLYFVLIASFTDPVYVNSGQFLLYPVKITTLGYKSVFSDTRIFTGYLNTLIYTIGGTVLGLSACLPAGYALSRRDLPARGIIMAIMVFTMYFSGGLIPTYLVVRNLGLTNSRFGMMLIGSVGVYNIILIRTFFQNSLPTELHEAAFIDGCSNARFFFAIALPLAKAIIAVIALYIAVAYWNAYFNAMIYLTDSKKFPLQLILREILLVNQTEQFAAADAEGAAQAATMVQVVKYGIIVISSLPIICLYPFLQKYFVKGVMIGSLKG